MIRHLFFILVSLSILSCGESDYQPKPKGYIRESFPEKTYSTIQTDCPFIFQIPGYSVLKKDEDPNSEPCWLNLDFPRFKARLHLSYKPVPPSGVKTFLEDSRSLVYKHTVKAEAIDEFMVQDSADRVFGIIYDIKGNTASSMQFILTDSNQHFLRGALYFNAIPNTDSISPALDFLKQDILKLIETFRWKQEK